MLKIYRVVIEIFSVLSFNPPRKKLLSRGNENIRKVKGNEKYPKL